MIIRYPYGNKDWTYEGFPGETAGYVSLKNLQTRNVFKDHYRETQLYEKIRNGELIVVEEPKATSTADFSLVVDTSQLERALVLAKELEEVLTRIGVVSKQ